MSLRLNETNPVDYAPSTMEITLFFRQSSTNCLIGKITEGTEEIWSKMTAFRLALH
jgi:hypothetical protein